MKKIINLSEKEIEAEYQMLSKLFPPKDTHCKIDRDVMPKIAESGKDETISFADAFEDFLAETIVTTSNGKYPILGESGRGGRIINGKLIEY